MGIKLDWQVESEQAHQRATEDPATRSERRRARRRLILLVIAIASLLCLSAALVVWRLEQVDNRLRQDLLDTVEIEVTALRIGDYASFLAIQRSASNTFMQEQSRKFEDYQQLKQIHRVSLTGRVLGVAIDNQRGRVVVEEIIDGLPYKVVWFYWYYEDGGESNQAGWRRVPDDLEFWGEVREITAGPVYLTYRDLDASLARALAPLIAERWTRGCQIVACGGSPPRVQVDIVAERPNAIEWSPTDPWTLRVTSPLVGRTRADIPVSPELERVITQQIAVRLVRYAVGDAPPLAYGDAAWLHAEAARWLAGQLMASGGTVSPDSGFMGTLIAQYGAGAELTVLRTLRPDSRLDSVINAVTGVSMPLLSVDQLSVLSWQAFFQWRLEMEARLLAQPDSGGAFLTLYDLENQSSANEATLRMESPAYAARPIPQVGGIAIARDGDSQTYAYVETSRTENGQAINETVTWRLASGTWKRVN